MLTVPGAGSQSIATSASGSFVSFADMTVPEVKDGRGWAMTETFRSICLLGIALSLFNDTVSPIVRHVARTALPHRSSESTQGLPGSDTPLRHAADGVCYNIHAKLHRKTRFYIFCPAARAVEMGGAVDLERGRVEFTSSRPGFIVGVVESLQHDEYVLAPYVSHLPSVDNLNYTPACVDFEAWLSGSFTITFTQVGGVGAHCAICCSGLPRDFVHVYQVSSCWRAERQSGGVCGFMRRCLGREWSCW